MSVSTSFSAAFITGKAPSFRRPTSVFLRPLSVTLAAKKKAVVAEVNGKEEGKEKKKKKGIMEPKPLSADLQEFVGAPLMARTEVLKSVWAYIKENNLQDPENKKVIVCDEKLKKIFGKDQVGFLQISGLLNPHFIK